MGPTNNLKLLFLVSIALCTCVFGMDSQHSRQFLEAATLVSFSFGAFFALLPQSRGFRRIAFILPMLTIGLWARVSTMARPTPPPAGWLETPGQCRRYPSMHVSVVLSQELSAGVFLARIETAVWESSHWRRVNRQRQRHFVDELTLNPGFHAAVLVPKNMAMNPGCALEARLWGRSLPHGLSESGFEQFLARRGATSVFSVNTRNLLKSQCPQPDVRRRILGVVDQALVDDATLSGRSLAAARALLLGRINVMDKEFRRFGKELGIVHIFAASGFHMAVFFACLHAPLAILFGRRHPAALLAPIPLCTAYVWFLGFPVSLCRSYVFVCFYAFQSLAQRNMRRSDLLLNSALVILMWTPEDAFSLSSLLSFGATAGIMYFYDTLRGIFPPPSNPVSRLVFADLSAGFAASVVAVPILVFVFHAHSFSAPAVNLVLLPLTGFALPILYLYAAVILVVGPGTISWVLGNVARHCMDMFVAITEFSSQASFYHMYTEAMSFPVVISALTFLCLILLKHKRHANRLRPLCAAMLLMLTPVGSVFSLAMARGALCLSMPRAAGFFGTSETWIPFLTTAPSESKKR